MNENSTPIHERVKTHTFGLRQVIWNSIKPPYNQNKQWLRLRGITNRWLQQDVGEIVVGRTYIFLKSFRDRERGGRTQPLFTVMYEFWYPGRFLWAKKGISCSKGNIQLKDFVNQLWMMKYPKYARQTPHYKIIEITFDFGIKSN